MGDVNEGGQRGNRDRGLGISLGLVSTVGTSSMAAVVASRLTLVLAVRKGGGQIAHRLVDPLLISAVDVRGVVGGRQPSAASAMVAAEIVEKGEV